MGEAFKHLRFGAVGEEQRRQLKEAESQQLAKRAASGVNEAYVWGQGHHASPLAFVAIAL